MLMETLEKELIQSNHGELNFPYWASIQKKIFLDEIPSSHEWTRLEDIVSILNIIGSVKGSNQMYYPTGGSFDIESASLSNEKNCIEIYTGHVEILKPKKLVFESFYEKSDWNFFRLETHNLEPSGVYGERVVSSEELVEIENGKYICRSYWDELEYEGKVISENARLTTRHLNGTFIIFSDSCPYDEISNIGIKHNDLSAKDFSEYIKYNA